MNKFIDFITKLFIEYPEGMFLYTGGMMTVLILNIIYKKEWDHGSLGHNGLWDNHEQLFVLFGRWIGPHAVLSHYCLPEVTKVTDSILIFIGVVLLYSLTGRWGLEWLSTMRTGTTIKKEKHEETTTISQQKSSNTSTDSLSDSK
jgi:hypothetical protein